MEGFVEEWNSHKIRTAGYKTPNQLFVEGVLRQARLTALDFFDHIDPDSYGTNDDDDENDIIVQDEDDEQVLIPESNFGLQEDHYAELQTLVNPIAPSESYGIDLYQATLTFIYDKIRLYPSTYGELTE